MYTHENNFILLTVFPLGPYSLCLHPTLSQVSVVNALDMQVVVSTVPPTLVEEKKEQLIR